MASDRAQGALIAAALAYSLDVGGPDHAAAHHRLLEAASTFRRSTVGDDGIPRCEYCGCEVRPHDIGSYRKAEGWAEVRRQGGTHALAGQRFTGDVACAACVHSLRLGIAPEQPSLAGL